MLHTGKKIKIIEIEWTFKLKNLFVLYYNFY